MDCEIPAAEGHLEQDRGPGSAIRRGGVEFRREVWTVRWEQVNAGGLKLLSDSSKGDLKMEVLFDACRYVESSIQWPMRKVILAALPSMTGG